MKEINMEKYNRLHYDNKLALECLEGWEPLLIEMLDKILTDPEPIKIYQIKEKFGGLRVYYEGGSDVTHNAVKEAEQKANVTCEVCGEVGKLRNTRWWRVLCDTHY